VAACLTASRVLVTVNVIETMGVRGIMLRTNRFSLELAAA
jgi:hypothetical protein